MIFLLSSADYDDVSVNRYRLVNHELRVTNHFAVYGDSAVRKELICFTLGGTYLRSHQYIDELVGSNVTVRNVLETNAKLLARNLANLAPNVLESPASRSRCASPEVTRIGEPECDM